MTIGLPDTKNTTPDLAPAPSNVEGGCSPVEFVELKQRFTVLSVIGVQFSIIGTPLAIGSYLTFILGVGGRPYFFYGYVVAVMFQLTTCVSMAEISSVFPHASGQIYWTAALAPAKYKRGLSYIVGSCTTLGWTFATAGSLVLTSQVFLASVEICQQTFTAEIYQVWLIAVAIAFVSIFFNTTLVRIMPLLLRAVVYFLLASTIYITVALLVRTNPKASAATVFLDVVNETGWSSNGYVFMLCLLPGSTAVSGFDCATHLTEELPRPDRQVPQIMLATAVLSALTGFMMVLVYLFCTTNPEALLHPVGGQPIFQVFYDSFNSQALLITALSIFCIEYTIACISLITTSSRVLWTFAKHGGTPFGQFLGNVTGQDRIPRNAIVATTFMSTTLSAIVFGPTSVLNAMYGASAITFAFSFGVPIMLLLINQRKAFPESRYINLAKAGPIVNVLSLCWQLTLVVSLSMPLYSPVTAANMNYAMPAAVTAIFLAFLNWFFYSREHFKAPHALYIEGFSNVGSG